MIVKVPCWCCKGDGVRELGGEPSSSCQCLDCSGTGFINLTYECEDFVALQDDMAKALRRLKKIMDKLEVSE